MLAARLEEASGPSAPSHRAQVDGRRPRLSIVTVNWNGWAHTRKCLESIRACHVENAEIIVIDNASADETRTALPALFPEVELVRNDENVGHVRGVNQGLRRACGEWVLVLDNDTELEPNTIASLFEFVEKHPEADLVSPRILAPDGSVEESARNFPSAWSGLFGRQSLLTRIFPGNPISRRYLARERLDSTEPFQIDSLSAACMFFPRRLLDEVGYWDEGFRGYWVDADWCMRLKQQGKRVFCVPGSHIVHYENFKVGRKKTPRRIWLFHQGAYRLYWKHYTRGRLDPRAIVAAIGLGARAALLVFVHSVLVPLRDAARGRGPGR
jgi:hypothetical protein